MRFSLRWLRDYASLDAPLDQLVRALIDTGTEVDRVEREAEGAVVARVVRLEAVPESRHGVRVADVDVGAADTVRVLTGAPNVRVGDLVPYAPPGTHLPSMDEPLAVRRMFGHRSEGMLCSAVELGLGDDAEGLLILDHGIPGQALGEVVDLDAVIEAEITPNRPDCLCHLGIARELAAALQEPLREPATAVPEAVQSATAVETRASVAVEDPRGCLRFSVRVVEEVEVGPSPGWLQRRLRAAGMRPINSVVDVTNFVALELGQPLHAFDLERFRAVGGDPTAPAHVMVRRAHAEERLLCLDGVERTLDPEDIVVCSGETAVSLAGVMGGESTAVGPTTRVVLLEAATWDGPAIRATARRHALRTEASLRFEKGLSDTLAAEALDRAAALIAELGAGRVLRGAVDVRARPLPPPEPITLPAGALGAVLGWPVDPTEAATALARLGFTVEQEGGAITVTPPHFRRDVSIPADVVEEVGRSLGYGRVPATLPGRRSEVRHTAPHPPVEDRVRDVCAAAGFDEVITYSFIAPRTAARLGGVGETRRPIPLQNPLSEEWSVLRTSLLPGVCGALSLNLNRGLSEVAVFEVGRAFWEGEREVTPLGSTPDGADRDLTPLPREPLLLAMVSQTGDTDGEAPARAIRHLQSVIAWLGHELRGATVTTEPAEVAGLRPGRSGRLVVDGRRVGIVGELDVTAVDALELRGRVAVAELHLDPLVPERPRVARFRQPSQHPAAWRDLSVVVPGEVPAAGAVAAIQEAAGPLLEDLELYDEYHDARLGAGRKALTFRLTYRAPDRTLTGAEVDACQEAVVVALMARCHAEVRR